MKDKNDHAIEAKRDAQDIRYQSPTDANKVKRKVADIIEFDDNDDRVIAYLRVFVSEMIREI